MQPSLSRFGLYNYNIQGLHSPACRDQKVYAGNLWALCFAVCFTPQRQQCPSECLTVPALIQLDDDDTAPDEDDSSPDDDE